MTHPLRDDLRHYIHFYASRKVLFSARAFEQALINYDAGFFSCNTVSIVHYDFDSLSLVVQAEMDAWKPVMVTVLDFT